MTLGVFYSDKYAVEETFQLLKIPWEWYESGKKYDVVIAYKRDLPDFYGHLIDLTETDYFHEIASLLNKGKNHLHQPQCEILLDQLRQKIKKFDILVEILPNPWNHPFMVALTHDVDLISVRERRWLSVGNAALRCMLQGTFQTGIRIILAKFQICSDPWEKFTEWMEMEQNLGIRSTFFFLPASNKPGLFAPSVRSGFYSLEDTPIPTLIKDGWEVGVHGIDNWTSKEKGLEEITFFKKMGLRKIGNRVHWLMFGDSSWKFLDQAGYYYDSSFGYNNDIGFRAGTLQVYRPAGSKHLLELPLHIQDIALFGKSCWELSDNQWIHETCLNLSPNKADTNIDELIGYAKKFGGVITVLWHYDSITPPKDYGFFYCNLIQKLKDTNSWISTAHNIVTWFLNRRYLMIDCTSEEKRMIISIKGDFYAENYPLYCLRVHLDPEQIDNVNTDFLRGSDYIDIKLSKETILVHLK
ncbi:MAG: hypothetical protein WC626_11500 [Methanoregula sp.]